MEPVVETLIRSPKLTLYVRQLERILSEEEQRRKLFYETMSEQHKVEFINGEIVMQGEARTLRDDEGIREAYLGL